MTESKISDSISAALIERLRAMPKAEIHVHIEGATAPETFYQIAQHNQIEYLPNRLKNGRLSSNFAISRILFKCIRPLSDVYRLRKIMR